MRSTQLLSKIVGIYEANTLMKFLAVYHSSMHRPEGAMTSLGVSDVPTSVGDAEGMEVVLLWKSTN